MTFYQSRYAHNGNLYQRDEDEMDTVLEEKSQIELLIRWQPEINETERDKNERLHGHRL